jgi:drug/metabolite transporter (DMT)-like permease
MISFSGVWVKVAEVSPTVSAFYRVFFGGLMLLAAACLRREIKWQSGRHFLLGLLCGLLLALDLGFFHASVMLVGPGLGTLLPNFQVFILAAAGVVLFKEPLRPAYLFSVPSAVLGLLLIVGIDWGGLGRQYQAGVFCGLASAAFYAGFILSLRRLQADQAGMSIFFVLAMVSLITAAFLAVEIKFSGGTFRIPDLRSASALLALGLFSHFVGWIMITNALPHIRASFSGLLLLLQPALAFVWDVFFFQRPTDAWNWAGVLLTLAAIYWGMNVSSRQESAAVRRRSGDG